MVRSPIQTTKLAFVFTPAGHEPGTNGEQQQIHSWRY